MSEITIPNVTEVREVTAKPFGTGGAHVTVPAAWLGHKLTIVKGDKL